MSGRGGWPRASARRTTRQYYFNLTPKVLSLALSRGLEIVFRIRIIFSSAAPSLVLASMFCKKLPDSYVFTATFKKIYIQLLHVLIGQSIQPSVRDVRGDEDCDIRIGGSCGVRDGDARTVWAIEILWGKKVTNFLFLNKYFKRKLSIYSHKVFLFF